MVSWPNHLIIPPFHPWTKSPRFSGGLNKNCTDNMKIVLMFKRVFLLLKKDKVLFLSIIFTLPSILIWLSGGISYLWSFIYKFTISRLTSSGQLFLLLVVPFIALNLALISYFKNKSQQSKKIVYLNLFFVLLVIVSSFMVGG